MKMNCCQCDAKSAAVALVRCCLGAILFFFGVGKLLSYPGSARQLAEGFNETWLPQLLVSLFTYPLPFVEVILGALLVMGICRTPVVLASGVFFIFLTLGVVVQGRADVAANNALYVFLTAIVLYLENEDTCILPWGNPGPKQGRN